MKAGTDLAQIGSLVGDPARANMLAALMGGTALTASELALEAGVTLPTASAHLAKLTGGGLTRMAQQGRHRYYALADQSVAAMLESITGVAAAFGPKRVLPGPRDKAMREARVCYDHLAGEMGVTMLDSFIRKGLVLIRGEGVELSEEGAAYFAAVGIDLDKLKRSRRPVCRTCLDWSVRRAHLAGGLGAAVLDRILALDWARREAESRIVRFTPMGKRKFQLFIR
ncbi:helix-turn-helix transcriptional regulator [Chelativorans sp. AA-79]|uniref:ArsR/SmtB family transcription factor n=1 Tax=Chelativorans sp. AA-79 TaxID=3028735 RepID=UPI0023F6F33A|nr:helix-turn-helix transcriptional regulator [Chelativorans sp. AA-79]WEX09373.1 helix-turn-helix transcriptional regulator [Chelativorans sp. AA-79]